MRELKVDIDYDRLASALKEPKRPWYAPDRLRTTLQTAALIIGGVWIAAISISVQEENNHVSIELLRSQQAQSDLQKTVAELSSTPSAPNQASFSSLGEKRVSKQIAVKEKFMIEPSGQTNSQGMPLYLVNYEYSFHNLGDHPKEVTFVALVAYQTQMDASTTTNIVEVNDIGQTGPCKWNVVLTRGNFAESKWAANMGLQLPSGVIPTTKGGEDFTGLLNPGETEEGSFAFLIAGKKTDWVGLEMRVGVEGAMTLEDRLEVHHKKPLSSVN